MFVVEKKKKICIMNTCFGCEIRTVYSCLNQTKITENRHQKLKPNRTEPNWTEKNLNHGSPANHPCSPIPSFPFFFLFPSLFPLSLLPSPFSSPAPCFPPSLTLPHSHDLSLLSFPFPFFTFLPSLFSPFYPACLSLFLPFVFLAWPLACCGNSRLNR